MEEKIIKVIDKVREMYKYIDFLKEVLSSSPHINLVYDDDNLVTNSIVFSHDNCTLSVLPNKIEYRVKSYYPNEDLELKTFTEYTDFDELLSL